MTREEAKDLFRNDKDSYGKPKSIMKKIDMIYDDFEKAHPQQVEDKMLNELNGFMKDHNIESINFGSHSLKKTKGNKAKPL